MAHDIGVGRQSVQATRLCEVTTDEFNPIGQVFAPPRRKVVQHYDRVASIEQTASEMRTDESCTPGDNHLHENGPRRLTQYVVMSACKTNVTADSDTGWRYPDNLNESHSLQLSMTDFIASPALMML